LLGAALVLLVALVVAASVSAYGPNAVPPPAGHATDCATGFSHVPGSTRVADWVVWCGTERGSFQIQFHPQKEVGPIQLVGTPEASGPGAGPSPACHADEGELFCKVSKSGPITIRGTISIPGDICSEHVAIWINSGRWMGSGIGGPPTGCPGRKPPTPPTIARIVRFREREYLAGAHESHAALIDAARRLRQAWIAEDPIARWTEGAWGVPLSNGDVKELQLRLVSLNQADRLIHDWLKKTGLTSIYAGWDWAPDGTIYVGFTRRPVATLARLRKAEPFVAPSRLKPFPIPPTHSEAELQKLAGRILAAAEKLERKGKQGFDLEDAGLDTLANKVELRSFDPVAARRWVDANLGPDAPVEVIKASGGELL
jgi:hypothetical protein